MLRLKRTAQFKKDVKLAKRRGKDIERLMNVIRLLVSQSEMPHELRDHELVGGFKGHRECHIEPDWLLIYRVERDELICTAVRTGTHSDLFGK
jgi:mRNA interferase YafQ